MGYTANVQEYIYYFSLLLQVYFVNNLHYSEKRCNFALDKKRLAMLLTLPTARRLSFTFFYRDFNSPELKFNYNFHKLKS